MFRGDYTITNTSNGRTSLEVEDISVLPNAIKELQRWGCDISGVIEAVHEIEDEQRKRELAEKTAKRLKEAAQNHIKSPANPVDGERRGTMRRFVVAHTRVSDEAIAVAEGIEYSNGELHIQGSRAIYGPKESQRQFEQVLEARGYSYHIEYID